MVPAEVRMTLVACLVCLVCLMVGMAIGATRHVGIAVTIVLGDCEAEDPRDRDTEPPSAKPE